MAGGRRLPGAAIGLIATVIAASIMLEASVEAAASHVVGGSTGWTIPPNSSFYPDWSSSQTIAAGDTLVFNFPNGAHNVIKVPKSSYDACSTKNQIGTTLSTGPATVTVTSGNHYYICGVGSHCSLGQKLAINVTAATTTPSSGPAPPPATDSTTTPAPGGPVPSAPGTTANPPTAPAPSSPSNGASSSPTLRAAATAVFLLVAATASMLL